MTRAFIIGNGPSLEHVDLLKLEDEVTFACGRIHVHPLWEEGWRPTEYFMVDRFLNFKWHFDLKYHLQEGDYPVVTRADMATMASDIFGGWWQYPQLRLHVTCGHEDVTTVPEEWHFPHFCTYGGSMAVMLQTALQREYSPVYVIGADLGYKVNSINHFSEDYMPINTYDNEMKVIRHEDIQHDVHRIAREEFEKRGLEVYNATAGGEVHEYERVDLGDVL